jgi:hypothetical protein
MLKKLLFATAAAALLTAATVPTQASTVTLGESCKDAAKALYPNSLKDRLHYRHECRVAWKSWKNSHPTA